MKCVNYASPGQDGEGESYLLKCRVILGKQKVRKRKKDSMIRVVLLLSVCMLSIFLLVPLLVKLLGTINFDNKSPTGETGGDYGFALCPSVRPSVRLSVRPSHSFSKLFFAMLLHTWMKVGSKLLYEELQIKFDFPQG